MTPYQYHYPYFIQIERFNEDLLATGWKARIVPPSDKHEEYLVIERQNIDPAQQSMHSLRIDFRTFLMVSGQMLYAWTRYADGLEIRQYQLDQADIQATRIIDFVETGPLVTGIQPHPNKLSYEHFVTFIRKPDLVTKEDYYEKYVIIYLHGQSVTMIPLDSFNETGGDPLYMWPALAVLDINKGLLHGTGMRMGSFTIPFDVHKLT